MMGAMRQTVTIQKAKEIAAEFEDASFTAAVEDAEKVGLASVEIVVIEDDGDGGEIMVLRPKTIMIAWKPREFVRGRVAVPGGTRKNDVHLTLLVLGDVDDYDVDQQKLILGTVTQIAQKHKLITGRIDGVGRFFNEDEEDGDPIWLGGDFVGLRELRDEIAQGLRDAGIEWEDSHPDYKPHITIGHVPVDEPTPPITIHPFDVEIDNVTVYIGGLEYQIELDGPEWKPDEYGPYFDGEFEGSLYVPVLKEAASPIMSDEKRYTYGPWYVPESVDLHNEWATRDHVQEALWKYVDRGDRGIRLQHNPEIVAGRWVELATVPFPLTVPIADENGVLQKFTYPAGTPFMGVIWEEWAWPLVKAGEIRGYSIGGSAQRILADMPATGAPDPAAQ